MKTTFREQRFDREIMGELGGLGFLGSPIEGYGCAPSGERVNYCQAAGVIIGRARTPSSTA